MTPDSLDFLILLISSFTASQSALNIGTHSSALSLDLFVFTLILNPGSLVELGGPSCHLGLVWCLAQMDPWFFCLVTVSIWLLMNSLILTKFHPEVPNQLWSPLSFLVFFVRWHHRHLPGIWNSSLLEFSLLHSKSSQPRCVILHLMCRMKMGSRDHLTQLAPLWSAPETLISSLAHFFRPLLCIDRGAIVSPPHLLQVLTMLEWKPKVLILLYRAPWHPSWLSLQIIFPLMFSLFKMLQPPHSFNLFIFFWLGTCQNHAYLLTFACDLPFACNSRTLDVCVCCTPAHHSQTDATSWQTFHIPFLHYSFLNFLISFITLTNPLHLFVYMGFITSFPVTGMEGPGEQGLTPSFYALVCSQFMKIFVGWWLFDWLLTARPWCCWWGAFGCTHVQMRMGGKWPMGKKGRFLARREVEVSRSLWLVSISEGWDCYFCLPVWDGKVCLDGWG